jgi:methyltransferase (TIGR00027 family)
MRQGKASFTAMVVALWRALGDSGLTNIPNFSDPGARKLLQGRRWDVAFRLSRALTSTPERRAGFTSHVDALLLRVVFIDAVIAAAAARQVVILGAGLDTRSWRLTALRGVRVFEVDFPATQSYKRARIVALGPALADVAFVPVDFRRDDLDRALDAAGHDPKLPTVWVWEGVIMYLDDEALRSSLGTIRRRSAQGSILAAHYHEPESSQSQKRLRSLLFSGLGEPQIGLRTQDVMRREIKRAGLRFIEDAGIPEQAARVGATITTNPRVNISRVLVAGG